VLRLVGQLLIKVSDARNHKHKIGLFIRNSCSIQLFIVFRIIIKQ